MMIPRRSQARQIREDAAEFAYLREHPPILITGKNLGIVGMIIIIPPVILLTLAKGYPTTLTQDYYLIRQIIGLLY